MYKIQNRRLKPAWRDAESSNEYCLTFWRMVVCSYSRSRSARYVQLLEPVVEGTTILQNVLNHSSDTASQPRILESSTTLLWEPQTSHHKTVLASMYMPFHSSVCLSKPFPCFSKTSFHIDCHVSSYVWVRENIISVRVQNVEAVWNFRTCSTRLLMMLQIEIWQEVIFHDPEVMC